jgi:SynChlorMet cassette protein ScmC
MQREILNLDITLGPLRYRLHAYDDWATGLIGRLAEHVACQDFGVPAHRNVHIVRLIMGSAATAAFLAGDLPSGLVALVQEELPSHGWQITGNNTTHLTWRHPDTNHTFWTESCNTSLTSRPFQMPLDLIFHDIIQRGGGIVHGGLVTYKSHGVLLTAPPGGGKTTAFSTAPANWQLESDDAALVWPDDNGDFLISPLPTWSVLLGVKPQLERIVLWRVNSFCFLRMVVFLEKSDAISLTLRRPLDAISTLYQSFSEYPTVLMNRRFYRVAIFRAAAALARTVPAWSLQLPRKYNFWSLLEDELANGSR